MGSGTRPNSRTTRGGDADGHGVVGHVVPDDRVRADDRAAPDADARAHDDVLAEPRAVPDLDRPRCRSTPWSSTARVGPRRRARGRRCRRCARAAPSARGEHGAAAEMTQVPAMFVPSPISSATSPRGSSVCRQEPGPTNTSRPIAIRPWFSSRTGGSSTLPLPNSAKPPAASSENDRRQARLHEPHERQEAAPDEASRSAHGSMIGTARRRVRSPFVGDPASGLAIGLAAGPQGLAHRGSRSKGARSLAFKPCSRRWTHDADTSRVRTRHPGS